MIPVFFFIASSLYLKSENPLYQLNSIQLNSIPIHTQEEITLNHALQQYNHHCVLPHTTIVPSAVFDGACRFGTTNKTIFSLG